MNGINKQTLQIGGGGWSIEIFSTEIDFGSWKPVRSKRFTITDAWVNSSSKIFVSWSWDTATWRVWNDWEWDSINFTAKAGTWNFTLTSNASGRIKGKRKIYYYFS